MSSDEVYLAFFQKVVERLEADISRKKEHNASNTHELLGLALTLVLCNLHRLAPKLDLWRVVEPALAESHRLPWDEVRPHVAALVERCAQVLVSGEEEDSDIDLVVVKGAT
ncbi:hypothetical protein EI012_27035, partial [Escherichia coli]|nr:hypothetical protein [Escherichia coli]